MTNSIGLLCILQQVLASEQQHALRYQSAQGPDVNDLGPNIAEKNEVGDIYAPEKVAEAPIVYFHRDCRLLCDEHLDNDHDMAYESLTKASLYLR